jgi:curli biogenesis system outer membrane secretion channel CsgG
MTSNQWMRRTVVAAALLLCGATSLVAGQKGGLRYTVVVDEFENKSEGPRALGNEWATLLTSSLQESGQFIVIAQTDAQLAALREQLRALSGVTTQGRKTAQRGKMAPAQLLVKGVITHFQEKGGQGGGIPLGPIKIGGGRKTTEIRATLQMIDTTTGALVAAKNFTSLTSDRSFSVQEQHGGNVDMGQNKTMHAALEKSIQEIIPWMAAQLPSVPWRGSVVRVDGKERVVINRGTREGVSADDEFVAGESEILRDPDTGEYLDEVLNERARIKVVQLSDRTATCSVVSGDAGQIVVGMAIQYSNGKN